MSTKTEHLGLHQWEPEDSFLRTDFNEDFARIDAGVGALQAFVQARSVTGSFTGTYNAPVAVDVGFRPRLVVYAASGPEALAVVLDGLCLGIIHNSVSNTTDMRSYGMALTDGGFQVPARESYFNKEGQTYRYIAFQ